ncbi:MAG: hypothetical protein MUO54_14430 [Anaerolineales bacterium]|nr:hypothetical protein [Anaerolineales bacterium]
MTKLTIFATPKPFTDPHIELIQQNAIGSWMQLGKDVEVVLVGDEEGYSEIVDKYKLTHLPHVTRNEWGTPQIDSIFAQARRVSQNNLLVYLNADIILTPEFVTSIQDIYHIEERFLVVGRRWDLRVEKEINFEGNWAVELEQKVQDQGKLHNHTAIDYFVFPREIFTDIPPFAIGRAGWDNWMVYHAIKQGWIVIDITPTVIVIHQEHDYAHLPEGKPHFDLDESSHNVNLGGGFTKAYDLLDVNWELSKGRIRKVQLTLPRLLRKLERSVMPTTKEGWRWSLTRIFRKLRRMVS